MPLLRSMIRTSSQGGDSLKCRFVFMPVKNFF
jgi:hypothetical protein